MSTFSTEALLRAKFQLTSATDYPPALLEDALAEAHAEILARLDPSVDTGTPPETLVTGETLLAAARAFRNLAGQAAATQHTLTLGGQRYDTAARTAQLLHLAATTEQDAWHTLAPHLTPIPTITSLSTTDTTPILSLY